MSSRQGWSSTIITGASGHLGLSKNVKSIVSWIQRVLCTEIPTLTWTIPFVRAIRTVREAITPVTDKAGTCWNPAETGVAKTTSYKIMSGPKIHITTCIVACLLAMIVPRSVYSLHPVSINRTRRLDNYVKILYS